MINALRMSPGASAGIQLSGQVPGPLAQAPGASPNKGIAPATQAAVAGSSGVGDSNSPGGAPSLPVAQAGAEARLRQNYVPRPSLAEEPNPFEHAFGDAIKGTYSLAGAFPAGLKPRLSTAFLKHIRAHPPENPALRKVLDGVLDPSAIGLAYRLVPQISCLACRVQENPCVNAILNIKGQEITGIRLLGAGNKNLWGMTNPDAESGEPSTSGALRGEVRGVKRKLSLQEEQLPARTRTLNEAPIPRADALAQVRAAGEAAGSTGVAGGLKRDGLVPQYDQLEPEKEARELLEKYPAIPLETLLERLKGEEVHYRKTECDFLQAFLQRKGMSTADFLKNYNTFVVESENYLNTPCGTSVRARWNLGALERTVFDTPLSKEFRRRNLPSIRNGLHLIEKELVLRYSGYNDSEKRKDEKEVDAFVNVALEIKQRQSKTNNHAKTALLHRPDLYPLEGDDELRKVLGTMPPVLQGAQRKRELLITALPEIAYKLKLNKDELFSAIRNWSVPNLDAGAKETRDAIEKELPLVDQSVVRTVMKEFARCFPESEPGRSTSSATSS